MGWRAHWSEDRPVDYRRIDYYHRQHYLRYQRYVDVHGLVCQACGGRGGDPYYLGAAEPPEPCGWCETTGKITRWGRGYWLRWCKAEKKRRLAKKLLQPIEQCAKVSA